MTIPPIVVPAPTFRLPDAAIDRDTTNRYARRIADTWARHIIVSGPMGWGECSTPGERAAILDLWLQHVEPARLIAACWDTEDVRIAQRQQVQPLVMLQAADEEDLSAQLGDAPSNSWMYANPRYSHALLTPELVAATPVDGVKLSKVTLTDIAATRAANPNTVIVHGSSRAIVASIEAGASLVTAAPLATLPDPWPAPDLDVIQTSANSIQQYLDELPTHHTRVEWITARAASRATS